LCLLWQSSRINDPVEEDLMPSIEKQGPIVLKKGINALSVELGHPPRYALDFTEPQA
jgi:hypothetical protein